MVSVPLVTDFLYTADFMVPDPDGFTDMVVAKLGIVAREDYRQAFPEHGYIAHFLRVNTSRAVAPTLFEPQHHVHVPNPADPLFEPHLDSLYEFQGRYRPLVTHSCVIATDEIHELIDKLHRRRLKFRIAPIDQHLAWERVWTGTSPEDPRYTPEVDGGLCLRHGHDSRRRRRRDVLDAGRQPHERTRANGRAGEALSRRRRASCFPRTRRNPVRNGREPNSRTRKRGRARAAPPRISGRGRLGPERDRRSGSTGVVMAISDLAAVALSVSGAALLSRASSAMESSCG